MKIPSITAQDILDKDFFELIGLESLPDDQKKKILTDMSKVVHARVYGAIFEALSEEERNELDGVPEERILDHLKEKGFDVPNMIVEEAQCYRIEVAAAFCQSVEEVDQLTRPENEVASNPVGA